MTITDKMIKASCSPTIYKRGTEYFREGRVHLKKRGDAHITAAIDDESIFTVDIEFNRDRITKSFCSCPYYQTMHSPCKHIIAAMMERQKELSDNGGFANENDKIAVELCDAFAVSELPKITLSASFILYIKSTEGHVTYSMAIQIDGAQGQLDGIDNFLECYAHGTEFKISKNISYIPGVTEFPPEQEAVIRILSGAYLDRSADLPMYTKAIYQTTFSGASAARILPHLKNTDFSVVIDGVLHSGIMFADDDPYIVIDIETTDSDISMSLFDSGTALTDDGEWFLYENTIYHTSNEWREYFMPIYNAAAARKRMQITFKGSNRLLFTRHILPRLQNRRGVAIQGVDELIINSTPVFDVYLDAARGTVTAVIIAHYGSIPLRLKTEDVSGEKIIVRDTSSEDAVLSVFDKFDYANNTFTLSDDEFIFEFFQTGISRLSSLASVHRSESFDRLFSPDDIVISMSVGYNPKIDLLETSFETNLSDNEVWEIINSIQLRRKFYRLSDGRFIDFEANSVSDTLRLLYSLDFSREEITNANKLLNKYYALYLDSAEGINRTETFTALISDMKNAAALIPDKLCSVLRDYQKSGIQWFKQLSFLGFGGILADDMGLGKTLQVLAYIHGEKIGTPTLIITPSALMYNWYNEIQRFIPDASALIIDGTKEERIKLVSDICNYEFIITSYPLLRRDTALYKELEFEYVFIDEAQHIKNPKTMNARAVKCINAKHRFAVTGTPIENSLSELWSIFDFIMPGYLYSLSEFREKYEYPIMHGEDTAGALDLRRRIKPFIMRRMKSEVLTELPERIEETIYADLTPPQKNIYSAFLQIARNETAAALSDGSSGRMRILALLMRLRQICCHPSLFDEAYNKGSGKLELLMEILETGISGSHRILVFSQFTSMLAIICEELKKRGITFFYLDGKTPSAMRAQMSERFNSGERDVFLISLKAGGTGLNLVGADMVIHYDPWWNPAVTDQASDRAHRLGQTRAVHIIKLASRATIEEKILRLQEVKRALADDIITANRADISSLSDEEILRLFE